MYVESRNHVQLAAARYEPTDSDEKIVREEIVYAWCLLLEKYAQPGRPIPAYSQLREELIRVGTDAGVAALVSERWYLLDFMVRDRIRSHVIDGLNSIDLPDFLSDLKEMQHNPELLKEKKRLVKKYILI